MEKINPTQKEPSPILTKHLCRVEPLPFGTTGDTVVQWTSSFGWQAKPVKALGPRGWLVGTADHAPPGLHVFNGILFCWNCFHPSSHKEVGHFLLDQSHLSKPHKNMIPMQTVSLTPGPIGKGPKLLPMPNQARGPLNSSSKPRMKRLAS